jgi:hypothetical protein
MNHWKIAGQQALISGAAASLLSAAVLAISGKVERDTAAGPLNGPSQWIFGRSAAYRRSATLRHTLTGFVIHHVTATGWALFHEKLFGARKSVKPAGRRLRDAAVTTAVANFVDYQLTPKRLQPGFEAQLSKKSLFLVYAAFAIGLAVSASGHRSRRTISRRD